MQKMATDAKALTVESSPTEILKSMSPEQRKAWRETGVTPELKEADSKEPEKNIETKDADPSPAAKVEVSETPEKKSETPSESVPLKVEPVKVAKGAESRIKELLADNKRLNSELEAARKVPVIASAKIEEVAKPRRSDVDAKTGSLKYATDEAFDEAYETYLTAEVTKKVEARHVKQQTEARIAEQDRILKEKWGNSLKIAIERHSDFAKVCEIDKDGAFQNAEIKKIRSNGTLDAFALDSEIGAQILYYLASNPGEVERIEKLAPFQAARELTKLEDKLSSAASTTLEKQPEGSAKKVSGAPAPASNVGGRATAPNDESEAAIKAGDFRRYMKVENEKAHLAKRKAS